MVAYYFSFKTALVKGSPNVVSPNTSVLIYDVSDVNRVTPITAYSDAALTTITNLVSDAYGIVPDFYTNNIPDVLWKSGQFQGQWATSQSRPGLRGATGPKGDQGIQGVQGNPGLNGAGTNADIAAYIPITGPTRDALDARYVNEVEYATDKTATTEALAGKVGNGELVISVKDPQYGAKGDGTTDDTAALNSAAAAAFALSPDAELYMPAGTYKTTGTVTVKCGLNASQATISYTGSGTALIIGSTVVGSGGAIQRRTYRCPRVMKTGTGWDGTSIGILAANLVDCEVHYQFIYQFERGLVCQGFGTGFAYNKIYQGTTWGNHTNVTLTQDLTGWCNSNNFFGGRAAYGTAWSTADDMAGAQVDIYAPAGATAAAPNNNVFWNPSLEANDHVYYRVKLDGRYNRFVNGRWEALSGSIPRIKSAATSDKNVIDGGYDVFRIVDVVEAGGKPPALINAGYLEYHANAATAKTFTAGGASNEQLVDTWTQLNGVQCAHNAGLFTPRAGMWRVKVTLGISCASATGYRLLTLKKGASVLDVDRKAGYAGLMTLTAESTEIFNGTESFGAYFDQTSPTGSDVTLSTTAKYCRVQAVYLGGA